MDDANCRWCLTPLRAIPGAVPMCSHCDLNAHDPTECVLCAAGARELERLLRDLRA